MTKKTEKQKLIDKLDYVFQMCIRYRDNFTCITCGKKFPRGERTQLHAGHFISRGVYSTRWDEENVAAECASCNMKQSFPDVEIIHKFEQQLKLRYGDDVIDRLFEKKHKIFKLDKGWLQDTYEFYKKALEEYEKQ